MKKFKKLTAVLLAVLMLSSLAAVGMAEGVSGEFTGSAMGIGGEVNVTLTITDGVITGCVAEGAGETQGIGSNVIASFPEKVVAGNCVAIDGLAGATITSTAFRAAAEAALASAGLNPADYQTPAAVEEVSAGDQVYEADIVVVGAGGAGMTAAITAHDLGADVIVVETMALVGGNSVRSTGGMNATGTEWQQTNTFGEGAGIDKMLASAEAFADNEAIQALAATVAEQWAAFQADPQGYFDSVELMELDTMIGGKGLNDPELVATLVENSADAIEWLDSVGIELHNVASFGGASVKRIHRPVNDEGKVVSVGAYVVPRLEQNLKDREIPVLFETNIDTIIMNDEGAAIGVSGMDVNGNAVTVYADAVVLTTGGFGGNMDMVVEYAPNLEGFMSTNAAGAQGQGIRMAEAVGAATVDLDQIQIHPTVEANTASLITEGLRGDGAILVNAEGMRFYDEVSTRDKVSAAEIAQTGSYSWLIVDQAMVDASSVIQGYITKGFTTSGETYEELAEAIGIPAEAFAETMNTWNGYVEAKNDPDFGRTSFANPLNTAPYYAIKVTAGIHHTMGGIKINSAAEVIDTDGNVIPGLFAAGETTGGVHGGNRLGGNAVADFTIYGRIAGSSAAALAASMDMAA